MTEIPVRDDAILVVMDARCGLCAGGARWIARHDRAARFRIVPMQSALGRQLFEDHDIDPDDPASWLYLEGDTALTGFEGWARVGQVIGGAARLLGLLLVIPKPLRRALSLGPRCQRALRRARRLSPRPPEGPGEVPRALRR